MLINLVCFLSVFACRPCTSCQPHLICWRQLTKKLHVLALVGFAVIFFEFLIYNYPSDNFNNVTQQQEPSSWHVGINRIVPLDCKLLAQQDAGEMARAKVILQHKKRLPPTPDWHFLRPTRYCDKFIRDRGYEMSTPSEEERNFPLAFSIRMHGSVVQAERLLRAIYRPQNVYCIHIDRASAPIVQTAMRSIIHCFPNVVVSSLYEDYVYESFSPVKADLQCVRQLLTMGVPWRYYLNLAGSEFPLRTNLELVHVLKQLNGTNDIEMTEFPDYLRFRITWHHFIFRHQLYRNLFSFKDPFHYTNVTVYKGSSYNMFSREFVVWLLANRIAQELIEWSRDTHSPEETVWATLNGMAGAPGGYLVNSSNQTFLSRAVLWRTSDGNHTCQGEWVHDICVFGYGDLQWLTNRQEMFANKFNINDDPIAYECLEQSLLQRMHDLHSDHPINWTFVQKS